MFGNGALSVNDGNLRHLYIEGASDTGTPFGADGRSSQVVVVSDLVVVSSGNSAIFLGGDVVLRDSVAYATGTSSQAIYIYGARNSNGTTELRNVTTWAPGSMSTAIYVTGSCEEDSSDPTICDDIWRPVVTAKNVVARGGLHDLTAYTNDARAPVTLNVSHSNYRPSTVDSSLYTVINDQGNNQSADPLFVNAASGDFHQLPGSPTIDAGTPDPQNGPIDIDGNPRSFGAAPDIGADEFFVAPAPSGGSSSGDCTIQGTSGNDTLIGTRGNDIICAGAGKDIVRGLGGNDVIRLGAGNDKGYGGAGKDRILGGAGRDLLVGGRGKDFLNGGKGRDTCLGARDTRRSC